ncbi:hypothetical protein BURK2_01037 [Burkholderiales bacterium]|nr:MAG: rhomboid family intramembrane serine protease [Burkholderiales bacterium]CAG0966681.1 hypothetical protein BURK2_01037 [Burkholderiales bacterium]
MLLIPFLKKPDWHHPPWVTLALILVNVLVFAVFQAGDRRVEQKAREFYRSSVLARLELPQYAAHLRDAGRESDARLIEETMRDPRLAAFANQRMERETAFMKRLHAGEVVRPDHPEYATWRSQREGLDRINAQSFTARYVFRADRADPITFISANFLHAGWWHLLGNMLILALTGFVVEEVLGRRRFLAAYLVAGLGATLLEWALHYGSSHGGLGASGAVSGVMGLYAVLFGTRRINYFLWLVFYFEVRRMPAVLMLPLWIANEILRAIYVGGPIGYAAHLGGFIAGGAAAALFRWRYRLAVDDFHERLLAPEQLREQRRKRLREAREHSLKLDFNAALAIYEDLLRQAPQDREIMGLAYRAARHQPAGDAYHRAALRILELEGEDLPTAGLVHETYLEYLQFAKPAVRLGQSHWLRLARRFCDGGFLADAERIVGALAKKTAHPPELPALLLRLAGAFSRAGKEARCRHWVEELTRLYPGSRDAAMGEDLLRAASPALAQQEN